MEITSSNILRKVIHVQNGCPWDICWTPAEDPPDQNNDNEEFEKCFTDKISSRPPTNTTREDRPARVGKAILDEYALHL